MNSCELNGAAVAVSKLPIVLKKPASIVKSTPARAHTPEFRGLGSLQNRRVVESLCKREMCNEQSDGNLDDASAHRKSADLAACGCCCDGVTVVSGIAVDADDRARLVGTYSIW